MMARATYPSDLTDWQWAEIKALIPAAEPGGREREVDMREVLNGILYLFHDVLRGRIREKAGRKVAPSAAILDSQSVKTTKKGGLSAATMLAST